VTTATTTRRAAEKRRQEPQPAQSAPGGLAPAKDILGALGDSLRPSRSQE
jgi:hypothetical protein